MEEFIINSILFWKLYGFVGFNEVKGRVKWVNFVLFVFCGIFLVLKENCREVIEKNIMIKSRNNKECVMWCICLKYYL